MDEARTVAAPAPLEGALPVVDATMARRLLLQRQGLGAHPRTKLDGPGLLALVDGLGFVQVDSINTLARAHHHILFSRNETYRERQLQRLLERDRSVFENWTHDAAVIPSRFYPYWRHKFAREAPAMRERFRKWHKQAFEVELEAIVTRISETGPVRARDLGNDAPKPGGGWWAWRPAKTAVEFLWRTGTLAICRREGFQKVYDLAERVIPEADRQREVDQAAFVNWACRSALARLGVATASEIRAFWDILSPAEVRHWCETSAPIDYVEVLAGGVDGAPPRRALAVPGVLDLKADDLAPPPRLRALSPFDPVLRDRKRALRLFGFDYRIEVFTPAAKRRYGYYVFPLLEGDRLIGRVDMARRDQTLAVRRVWWEPGIRPSKGRMARFEAELDRLRRFAKLEAIAIDSAAL